MTLDELQFRIRNTYGRRHKVFLPNRSDRINLLSVGIGDLQHAVRIGASSAALHVACARVVARIFCVADAFQYLPLNWAMSRKFPSSHCSYCETLPCSCTETRPSPKIIEQPDPAQLFWSLNEWCDFLDKLYGAGNRKRGIENILNRLFKEVAELYSLEHTVFGRCYWVPSETEAPDFITKRIENGLTLTEVEDEYAFELSDTLSWTIAAANVLQVDLEVAFLDRYGNGCRACNNDECQCTVLNFVQAVLH